MQFTKTPNGWRGWCWHRGKRFDRRAPTKNKTKDKLLEALREYDETTPELKIDGTVDEVVQSHLSRLDNQNTARRRKASWKRHSMPIADLPIDALTVSEVASWREVLRGDPRTRDTEFAFATLRSALDDIVEVGGMRSNPSRQLRRRRRQQNRGPQEARRPIYTPEELAKLKRAAKNKRLGGIMILMAETGLRTGEALGLCWDAIDGDTLHVRQQLTEDHGSQNLSTELKTANSHRSIYVAKSTVSALGSRGEGLVFRSRTGGPVWRRAVRTMWKRIHNEAGVECGDRNLYSLRHTHASMLVAGGQSIPNVAARLGDKPETVLAFYAHAIPGEDPTREAVNALVGAPSET